MTSRPRLLFLSHRLPFPPHNGAAIRTFNILRLLARDFDVTALCFDRRDAALAGSSLEERVAGIAPYAAVDVFAIPQDGSRRRLVADHLRSMVRRRPYTWYVHESRAALARLRALLATTRFDVVHVDSLDLVRLLPELGALPVVCTHHNVESQLLRRRAGTEPPVRRAYLRHQAGLLEAAERAWLPRVRANVTVSDEDADTFRAMVPGARCVTIPNGVDVEFFRPLDVPQQGCVFVGGTSWYPNRDALAWFAADILPRLRALGVADEVAWVGRARDEERTEYERHAGLRLTGYVDDIRPHVAAARCFIAPLRVGGGTRLKLLDAWAMGKAIVSTTIGAEGLGARHEHDMLLADTAEDFAQAVRRVLADDALRRRLERNARIAAVERFGWEAIGARMRALYCEVAGRASQVVAEGSAG